MRLLATCTFLYTYVVVAGSLSEFAPNATWFIIWPTIILIGFVAISVHELGHAAALLMAGGRVAKFAVMPFELTFRPWRLRLAPRKMDRDIGGYVAREPGWTTSVRNDVLISAAGPIANFLLTLIALAGAFWFDQGADGNPPLLIAGDTPSQALDALPSLPDPNLFELGPSGSSAVIAAGAKALAFLSLGMGLSNLIPFAGSDGQRIVKALRKRHGRERL